MKDITIKAKTIPWLLGGIIVVVAAFFLGNASQQIIKIQPKPTPQLAKSQEPDLLTLQEKVLPSQGFTFKIKWGDLGKKMIQDGVIDESKLAQAVTGSDTLPPQFKKYLDGSLGDTIELNGENAQFWVDVLWGMGLANKNDILETGPMVEGGQTANFASTGGYTIGAKPSMSLYNKFSYIKLTAEQQVLVKKIAGSIYRPCCNNSTAFPDCNHGMAALALVELLVSQNYSEEDIYQTVLAFNSYWFPQTYLDIAYLFNKNGKDFSQIPPKEILSKTFSSSSGYLAIKNQIGVVNWPNQKKTGCGA